MITCPECLHPAFLFFVVIPSVFMGKMQRTLPCLVRQYQIYLQIWYLLTGLLLTLKEWAAGPAHWMIKSTKSPCNSRSYHYSLTQSVSRFESCVQTLSQTVTTKVTSIEHVVGGLAARVASLKCLQIPFWILASTWTKWWLHSHGVSRPGFVGRWQEYKTQIRQRHEPR